MSRELVGRSIIVTGAEGLLGSRWSSAIASAGGNPISIDKTDRGLTCPFGFLSLDLTCSPEFITGALEQADLPDICGIVHAAAYNPNPGVDPDPDCDWDAQMGILRGARILTEWVVDSGRMPEGSSIVFIGSDLSLTGPDPKLYAGRTMKPVHYTVAKHATVGLMRHYAMLYASRHIRVNCLCPGAVRESCDDDFALRLLSKIPIGRLASATDYDDIIVFLLSDASRYMTGSVVVADGGRTCL